MNEMVVNLNIFGAFMKCIIFFLASSLHSHYHNIDEVRGAPRSAINQRNHRSSKEVESAKVQYSDSTLDLETKLFFLLRQES